MGFSVNKINLSGGWVSVMVFTAAVNYCNKGQFLRKRVQSS